MRSNKLENYQTIINLVTGILAMIVNLAVSFFLTPYIVSTLGEEANGFTQLANNFVSYAALVTLALNSMASRFISVAYHRGRVEDAQSYYTSVTVCNIILVILLFPIAFYIVSNLNNILVIGNVYILDVQILFGCVFLNFFLSQISAVLGIAVFVKNKLYIQNIITLFQYIFNAITLLVMFTVFPPKIFYIASVAVCLSLLTLPFKKYFQNKLMPELRFHIAQFRFMAVRQMLAAGIWNTVNQCGHMLMTGLDLLLCDLFISPASMGLLSVAKTVPNAIITLATTLNTNFAPALTMDWAHGNRQRILKELRSSMRISSVILSICIITFSSYAVAFYRLWMPSLDARMLALLSFLTCMVFIPWAGPQALYNVFTATNRLRVNSISFVISGFLNVFIVYFSLRYTDLEVIAVAGASSTITILRNILITAPYTAKLLGLKWNTFYKDILISLACCMIVFFISVLVQFIIPPNGWNKLIISVIFTCLISFILEIIFVLNAEERKLLLRKLRKEK